MNRSATMSLELRKGSLPGEPTPTVSAGRVATETPLTLPPQAELLSAEAEAVSASVKVLAVGEARKSMRDRERATWDWNISSPEKGPQVISIAVRYELGVEGREGPLIEEEAFHVTVEFVRPFLTVGQLNLTMFLAGIGGSVMSAPFLYGVWKDWRKSRKPEDS